MATLIAILGLITFIILVIGLGIFAGGAIMILLAKLIIPIVVAFAVFKIITRFFNELGGRH